MIFIMMTLLLEVKWLAVVSDRNDVTQSSGFAKFVRRKYESIPDERGNWGEESDLEYGNEEICEA